MRALNRAAADPPPLRLGGRGWRTMGSGVLREKILAWITPQLAANGIKMQAHPGESSLEFAERLYLEVRISPVVFPLLGCLFIPQELLDAQWSPGLAVQTGKSTGKLWHERDKEIVAAALISWSLGQAGIDLDNFLGLSPLASKWRM